MNGKSSTIRSGLLAGGNWIIDQVKLIDVYPQPEQLANTAPKSKPTWLAIGARKSLSKIRADKDNRVFR